MAVRWRSHSPLTIVTVALTVVIVWICIAVPLLVVFAAIGKSGLREEAARDRLRAPVDRIPQLPDPQFGDSGPHGPAAERVRPLAAEDAW